MKNLFNTPYLIPNNVKDVIDTWNLDADPYHECKRLEEQLKPLGYIFDWGLDGEPMNLRKIE